MEHPKDPIENERSTMDPQGNNLSTKQQPLKTLFGLSSFQVLAMFRRGLFYTFLSIYMREYLQMSVTATTLWETIPMCMSGIFQVLVWGRLSDRLQKRRSLIVLGEILAGSGLLITFFIHRQTVDLIQAGYVIVFGLSIIEIFWSMSNISWSALISDLYPSKDRTRIMGQLTSLGGGGRILGVVLGSLLYDGMGRYYEGWGFREGWLFILASIVMFLSTIPMLFVPEGGVKGLLQDPQVPPDLKITITSTDTSTTPTATTSAIPFGADPRKIGNTLKKKGHRLNSRLHRSPQLFVFILFIIALFIMNFGRNSVDVLYSQFLVLPDTYNLGSTVLGWVVNLRSVATILLGLLVGMLSKKMGNARTLFLGILSSLVALVSTAFIHSVVVIFIASFFFGMGEVIISAASYAYAASLIPESVRASPRRSPPPAPTWS